AMEIIIFISILLRLESSLGCIATNSPEVNSKQTIVHISPIEDRAAKALVKMSFIAPITTTSMKPRITTPTTTTGATTATTVQTTTSTAAITTTDYYYYYDDPYPPGRK
ncbi:hypothetical protein TELCIR_22248, partial [Teladorsagia circumcincta]